MLTDAITYTQFSGFTK